MRNEELPREELNPAQPEPAKESGQKEPKEDWRQSLFEWLQLLVIVLVVIVGVFTFLGSVIGVDGSSMYPTLHNGDLMLVRRIAYTPTQGDVVVLRKDGTFDNEALVKRIIATGSQTVYIDYDANTITVDGQVLDEPYLNYEYDSSYGSDCMADLAYLDPQYADREFTVPEGCVFVCGDNRNPSSDSRSAALGMVDERYVIGEVLLVFFPFNHFGLIK